MVSIALAVLLAPATIAHDALVVWSTNDSTHLGAPGGSGFSDVSAGSVVGLAVRADGSLAAWGLDTHGVLSGLPAGNDFTRVDVDEFHAVALRSDGSIVSWGGDDAHGQVSGTPTGTDFVQVSAGKAHSVALRSDGSIVSWGNDQFGSVSGTPPGPGFTHVDAGGNHSVALRADGSIESWGQEYFGVISGTPFGTGFVDVTAGLAHSVAIRHDGSLVSWGHGGLQQHVGLPTGTGFVQVSAGYLHSVARRGDGSVETWGGTSGFFPQQEGTGFAKVAAGNFSVGLCAASGPPHPPVTVRVSAKRVLSGDVQQCDPAWGDPNVPGGGFGEIEDWITGASEILEREADITLELVEVFNLVDPGTPVSWFDVDTDQKAAMEAAAQADPCAHGWRDNAINIYFVNSRLAGVLGICSFPGDGPDEDDIVLISPDIESGGRIGEWGLAHELGHYFNLRHTFANHEPAGGGCSGGSSGDCVCDTPDDIDPNVSGFDPVAMDQALASLHGAGSADYDAVRYNIMSYHGPITVADAHVTFGQSQRMGAAIDSYRQAVVVSGAELLSPPCAWNHLGLALPGLTQPVLGGEGTLQAGDPLTLTLTSTLGNSAAWLIVGFSQLDQPFKGGYLVPPLAPPSIVLPLLTDGNGDITIPTTMPSGTGSGLVIYFQCWMQDPTGPQGFAASNGLSGTTP